MREAPNPQAFPVSDRALEMRWQGMTLRDYFAGQAVCSMMGSAANHTELFYDVMASDAYLLADAMLKERQKTKQ